MPDTGASRKRQIACRRIPGDLAAQGHRPRRVTKTGSQRNSPKRQPREASPWVVAGAASITRACYLCNIRPKTSVW